MNFRSGYEGQWQVIPADVLDRLEQDRISVAIKFGMNLLRMNSRLDRLNVLSYHYGDPSRYRGRPPGFFELMNNEPWSGIIVQKLSNTLDAGDVLAFALSDTVRTSYRQTARIFFSASKDLLRQALENLGAGNFIDIEKNGKNCTLPGNILVIRFILRLALR